MDFNRNILLQKMPFFNPARKFKMQVLQIQDFDSLPACKVVKVSWSLQHPIHFFNSKFKDLKEIKVYISPELINRLKKQF